jgi:hypothetical protein
MRTLVDIPDDDLTLLHRLSKIESAPRAELVRQGIARFLEPYRRSEGDKAFGLWSGRSVDGVAYQRKLRGEWPE